MKLQVLGTRVLVKPNKNEEVTKSGIVIPELAQEKPQRGKVLGIGSEVEDVKIGDFVIYPMYTGSDVVLEDNSEVLLIQEFDILAVDN